MGLRAPLVRDLALGVMAGMIPLVLAIVHAQRSDGIEAACDEGVVRVMGHGYTGVLRGLDALVGSKASIACAGFLGVATFVITRRLVRKTGVLGLALAVVAAVLATATFPAEREAVLVSGNTIGALLVMLPIALVISGAPMMLTLACAALGATYDASIAASTIAGLATLFVFARKRPKTRDLLALLVSAIPIAWMLWRRDVAPESSIDVAPFSSWLGEGGETSSRGVAFVIARNELGLIALVFAGIGAFFILRSRITRAIGASLLAITCVGMITCALGAPAGPARFGGGLIASLAAISVFSACGMATIVTSVAGASIPLARASAAMIVLLEVAVPVRVLDDASLAISKRDGNATARWNARVFGELPPNTVLLLPTARLFLRARAAHASGALRDDVIVIATFGLGSRATSATITREPLVSPLVRDLALYGAPEEFSLSQLAATRPLLVAFDPRWDKRFARHLMPQHGFDHYFVEPRGAADRLKAYEPIEAHDVDVSLILATRDLMRARAMGAAASGEREWADATNNDLRRAAPLDPIGVELARRISQSHGPVDVSDLAGRLSK